MSKRLCTCVLVLLLLTLLTVPSQASLEWTRITNPGNGPGDPDGIVPGGDRNNSYAWCMEVLPTPDGDYLYVGSNRNLGFFIIGGNRYFSDSMIEQYFNNDLPSAKDFRSRIYRYRLDGSEPWEEVYVSPTVFSGDVGAFSTTAPNLVTFFGGEGTNVILGKETGYRGMQVFTPAGGDLPKLYVVSFNILGTYSRILEIDGSDPASQPSEVFRLEVNTLRGITEHNGKLCVGAEEIYETEGPTLQKEGNNTSTEGWSMIATSEDLNGTAVWDLISYNGYLYSFNSQLEEMDDGGFSVYKGYYAGPDNPDSNEAGWIWTTIAGEGGKYPYSMGHIRPNAASPFLFDDKVYVGTLASMPEALMGLVADAADEDISLTEAFQNFRALLDPPQIYRFGKDDDWELITGDPSENMDLSSNRIFQARLGNYGGGFFNPNLLQVLAGDTENYSFLQYVWRMEPYEGKLYATTFDIRVFLRYFTNFVTDPDKLGEIETLLSRIDLYNPDPAGTNIYSSEDGISWTPVITDGFGDPYNYGGRTIKATEKGLFVGTANPFWGAQVWKAKDTDSTEESTTTTEETDTSGSSGSGCNIGHIYPYTLLLFPLLFVLGKKIR